MTRSTASTATEQRDSRPRRADLSRRLLLLKRRGWEAVRDPVSCRFMVFVMASFFLSLVLALPSRLHVLSKLRNEGEIDSAARRMMTPRRSSSQDLSTTARPKGRSSP